MKKEEIYVEITNEQERLRAIEILQKAGEEIWEISRIFKISEIGFLRFYNNNWVLGYSSGNTITQITLDQLEEMLLPKQSNVFVDVQRWIRENLPNVTYTFQQGKSPECFKRLEQHLQNDYPKGTEIKISKDKIEIYQL